MTFLAQLDAAGPLAIGGAIGVAACAFPHLRRGYHQWRLARRLRRNPYMLAEEQREYERAIGEELPALEPGRLALAALFLASAVAIPLWFAGTLVETLWEHEWLIVTGIGGLYFLWRRLNDPPELHAEAGLPEIEVPRDAWLGLVGAVAVVALMLLAIKVFF